MSMKTLGASFDLHLGGEDLIFPHHEDEIAQSEGAGAQEPGRPFVKYWMHGAHLLVEGKKMSKSLGNYFTVRDLLAQGFTGREIRCALLGAHYRESFNFTLDGLRGARQSLARLDECLAKLRAAAGNTTAPPDEGLPAQFAAALDEDFNVSGAWAAVFDWVRENNRLLGAGQAAPLRAAAALAGWDKVDGVLAVGRIDQAEISAALQALLEERQAARKARDFKRADALRDELKSKGWTIEDTPKGARLKKL
jgi:cysteinyl-tRNA synthetase